MRKGAESSERLLLIEKHREAAGQTDGSQSQPEKHCEKFFDNRISITITEFAARSGLSTKSVERMIKREEIQAKRVGRRVLIPMSAIEAWLNSKE